MDEKFDIQKIRNDFPILKTKVHNNPLVFLDNAASTQKPEIVINTISDFYKNHYANIHRGMYHLSNKSTNLYEESREKVKKFINAPSNKEIIFTRGTTESINLVASSFGEKFKKDDEIIISEMEHHSNIVPWQLLRQQKGIKIKIIPITENLQLNLQAYSKLFTSKTKLVSVVHISNSLGTINPISDIIDIAHSHGVPVFVDAAQSIQHTKIDVQELDVDFLAFSGHKIYSATGIGVLYGKKELLSSMPPYQGGGDMIKNLSFDKTTYADLPLKFEAGTTNFSAAISLKTAIEYVEKIGIEKIQEYEKYLYNYAVENLKKNNDVELYTPPNKSGMSAISFNLKNVHHADVGIMLDNMGVAVRTGGHCTYPVMRKLNVQGTVRASIAFYNTTEEIDHLCSCLPRIKHKFL